MISNDSKILLTVSRGKSLAKAGVYESAKTTVKNSWYGGRWSQLNPSHFKTDKGEELIVHEQMKTIEPPAYKESTQVVNLNEDFIKMALTRPVRPKNGFYRWVKTPIGKLFQDWKYRSDEQKIQVHLEELAESMGGTVKSWDLI